MTLKGQTRDPSTLRVQISRKRLDLRTTLQRTKNRNGIWAIKWSRDRWCHVTSTGAVKQYGRLS